MRVKSRKGSQKAKGAVGRHLAEATWAVLTYGQEYREPQIKRTGRGHKRETGMNPERFVS